MKRALSVVAIALVGGGVVLSRPVTTAARAPQAAASTARASETALDRYVAAPDPSFTWTVSKTLPADGATATLIDLTSQRWLTEQEVEQPLWKHWLVVVTPAKVTSDIGLPFISAGRNDRTPPAAPAKWLLDAAIATGTVVAELRMVPNQPVVFKDDPARKPRTEDDFIAYTWDKFVRTGDRKWPARLPMTKSAVRAMDAVTAFAASAAGGSNKVGRFVVAGASKRGWTTWTTAAVDTRVVASVTGARRPEFSWTFEKDGSIKVLSKDRPEAVALWQATNPEARNFRLDVIGPSAYTSTALTPSGPNTWVGRVAAPAKGWTAAFVE